ncbi:hypothetical protein GIB67_024314 [Kingdonia uniflora]|uniref:GRPD C-terminal domain-containing protein n=1 Tax=Kingdonia uniflora TaxID=39325 RepID=A0A7J7LFB3_9MAGN|nr:hypothetical protein GIB67_024314 [Kingdonia uniflora]
MSSVSTDTRVSVPKTFLNVRDISDISDPIFRMSIDLVAASRRQLSFLRLVSESHWLHNKPTLLQAIRRYDELWMPLLSDLGDDESNPPMVLPPFDVQWVWHCHTLNPASYRLYCESRFSKMLQKPLIFDDENEDYGLNRCRDIWDYRYPFEPFELEPRNGNTEEVDIIRYKDIFDEVSKNRYLYSMFSEPYMLEMVYLIVAKQRYKGFLCMLQRYRDGCSRFVPTLDIQLMWLTHKSYPLIYAEDVKEMVGDLGKVAGVWDSMKEEEVEATKKIWERIFYQPYEKAGATLNKIVVGLSKPPAYWEVSGIDVNTKYKSLQPRFLQEVCVFVRGESGNRESQSLKKKNHDEFLCLRAVRCHKEFKLSKPITSIPSDTWGKMWHLICEFNTRGITLELVQSSSSCLERSKSLSTITFVWNDLLRAPSLILERELEQHLMAVASVTPPIQAPYLLKCVPDRVTDDSGAMISEVILKRNQYRPQEGRWLSRSVLDHAGHECFVVRIRVGSGFWRRGGEAPSSVKLTERIVEIREGSWSYVAGSIGVAPAALELPLFKNVGP